MFVVCQRKEQQEQRFLSSLFHFAPLMFRLASLLSLHKISAFDLALRLRASVIAFDMFVLGDGWCVSSFVLGKPLVLV